jgi:hypothetical protein
MSLLWFVAVVVVVVGEVDVDDVECIFPRPDDDVLDDADADDGRKTFLGLTHFGSTLGGKSSGC